MTPRERSHSLGRALRDGDAGAWREFVDALRAAAGDITGAAQRLGIPRRTLHHWRHSVLGLDAVVLQVRRAAEDGARTAHVALPGYVAGCRICAPSLDTRSQLRETAGGCEHGADSAR